MTDTDDPAAPDRDAAPTLTYEGTAIRQRGLMLNLTDMWRAAGGPAYRRPALWLDMEETKRFRRYARWRWSDVPDTVPDANVTQGDICPAEPDGLVATARGHNGGTWAHWVPARLSAGIDARPAPELLRAQPGAHARGDRRRALRGAVLLLQRSPGAHSGTEWFARGRQAARGRGGIRPLLPPRAEPAGAWLADLPGMPCRADPGWIPVPVFPDDRFPPLPGGGPRCPRPLRRSGHRRPPVQPALTADRAPRTTRAPPPDPRWRGFRHSGSLSSGKLVSACRRSSAVACRGRVRSRSAASTPSTRASLSTTSMLAA